MKWVNLLVVNFLVERFIVLKIRQAKLIIGARRLICGAAALLASISCRLSAATADALCHGGVTTSLLVEGFTWGVRALNVTHMDTAAARAIAPVTMCAPDAAAARLLL